MKIDINQEQADRLVGACEKKGIKLPYSDITHYRNIPSTEKYLLNVYHITVTDLWNWLPKDFVIHCGHCGGNKDAHLSVENYNGTVTVAYYNGGESFDGEELIDVLLDAFIWTIEKGYYTNEA